MDYSALVIIRNEIILLKICIIDTSTRRIHNTMRPTFSLYAAQNMGWTSGSTSNLVGWGGGSGGGNPGSNAHGWVDEKGSGSKGTVGQVVDAVAEAAKAEGK